MSLSRGRDWGFLDRCGFGRCGRNSGGRSGSWGSIVPCGSVRSSVDLIISSALCHHSLETYVVHVSSSI